jgi:hypothetical protein
MLFSLYIFLLIFFIGSKSIELAINLIQLLVHKLRVDNMSVEQLQGMTSMVDGTNDVLECFT